LQLLIQDLNHTVFLNKNPQNDFELIVSDNGIGLPKHFNWHSPESLGLRLVKILAEDQLKGTLSVQSDKGTQFAIRFKEEESNA